MYAGSARHPPNSSRCTAAMSQHVVSRTPAAMSARAVSCDQTTHRGRISRSARSSCSGLVASAPPGTATATDPSGPTAMATRPPGLT